MLVLAPQFDQVLHPVKNLRLDYGLVAVFDEILWDDPFVDHHLFGQVVFRILFLEQGTPLVLFVPKKTRLQNNRNVLSYK